MKDVVAVIGAGGIGQAVARRIGAGKHVVLADLRIETAQAAAKILENAGFETSATQADLASRESIRALIEHARGFGPIRNLVNAAGVSPSQAPVAAILKVDLYGTSVLLAEFLMSSRGRWITGSDFLIDGGTTASYFYGDLQYLKATH